MTLLPELRADLERAANRPSSRLARLRPAAVSYKLGGSLRRTPLLTAGAVAVVLAAGGAATAAVTGWTPKLGDDRRGHPTADLTSPPASQLERLAVLRRSPTAADRGPDVRRALRFFGPSTHGIRTGSVRYLGRTITGRAIILVPVANASGTTDALCLWVADVEGGGYTCSDTNALLNGSALLSIGNQVDRLVPAKPKTGSDEPSPKDRNGHYLRVAVRPGAATTLALVPDGVARVQAGRAPAVEVRDNLAVLRNTTERPGVIRWLDARGRLVPQQRP